MEKQLVTRLKSDLLTGQFIENAIRGNAAQKCGTETKENNVILTLHQLLQLPVVERNFDKTS